MDYQLKELNNLMKHCHSDFKDSVQKAIDERKAEIGYVEVVVIGIKDTYDKMCRMAPEIGEGVVFFSDETTELLVDFFVEEDIRCMNSDTMAEILRDGFQGYESWTDMELLTHYMNYYDEDSEVSDHDMRVKEECDMWIAITIEQALGLGK